MTYESAPVPDVVNPDTLLAWISGELDKLKESSLSPEFPYVQLTKRFAAPTKPREGRVYFADGTTWNPGAGGGLYLYFGGAFVKL